jgi:hypothetical protein
MFRLKPEVGQEFTDLDGRVFTDVAHMANGGQLAELFVGVRTAAVGVPPEQ